MKRFLLLALFICLSVPPLSADNTPEVLLRSSRQDGNVRLVVESTDEMVNHSSVSTSLSVIKIDFPSVFEITGQPDFIFPLTRKDRSLLITLKDAADVKTMRLAAPARIVFDVKTMPRSQRGFLQQIEKKLQDGNGQTDLKAPPPVAAARKVKVVVIDAGHGGYDFGIVDQEAKEKDIDLSLAKELGNFLAKKGRTVFLTRKADQSGSLAERIDFSNKKKPDLFISIHGTSAEKFAVYTSTVDDLDLDPVLKMYSSYANQDGFRQKSTDFADSVGSSLKAAFGKPVVLRQLPLPVLYSMNAPSVLIEYPSLKSFASSTEQRTLFVNAVINAIANYER
jgi:N-acetylmuramoyl-L-alanine amidase